MPRSQTHHTTVAVNNRYIVLIDSIIMNEYSDITIVSDCPILDTFINTW